MRRSCLWFCRESQGTETKAPPRFRFSVCAVAAAAALTAGAMMLAGAVATPAAAQNILLYDNVGSTNNVPERQITVDPGGVPQTINRLGFLTGDNSAGQPVSQRELRGAGTAQLKVGVDATEFFAPDDDPNNTTTFQRFRAGDNFSLLHFGSNAAFNLSHVTTYMYETVDLDEAVPVGTTPTSGFQGLYIAIFQDLDETNTGQTPPDIGENMQPRLVAGGFGDQDLSDGFQTGVNNRLITTGQFAPEFVGYRYQDVPDATRRPIFKLTADLSDITLAAGNYFISISAVGRELSNPVSVVPFTPTLTDPYRVPNPDINPTDPFGMAQPDDGPGTVGDPNNPAVANALVDPNSSVFILFDLNQTGENGFQGVEIPFEIFSESIFLVPEPGTVALMLTGSLPVLGIVLRRVARRRRGQSEIPKVETA